MTAPLHHINQMYLHLPAINGQVAAQASISEELQQISRQAQDQAYRRDIVEVVAETNPSQGAQAVHREYEPLVRANLKKRDQVRAKIAKKSVDLRPSTQTDTDLLVDVRV